jgi:radial spoke head protein 4A
MQGRCKWVNPSKKGEDEAEEEEEEEDGVAVKMEVRPEVGPPLLNPLSEDISVEGTSPWSMRISSKLFPHYAVAVVRSNLWPGAYTFAKDKCAFLYTSFFCSVRTLVKSYSFRSPSCK